MGEFDDAGDTAMGFYIVADFAVLLLSQTTGRSIDECLHDLALALAAGREV
jgi:hypothetical protein